MYNIYNNIKTEHNTFVKKLYGHHATLIHVIDVN